MLTRNCATENLFEKDDFNVRTTMFCKNPKYYVVSAYKAAWIETIRDCLGGFIVNNASYLSFKITYIDSNQHKIVCPLHETGINLSRRLKKLFDAPQSIRIDVITNCSKKSWVIIVP